MQIRKRKFVLCIAAAFAAGSLVSAFVTGIFTDRDRYDKLDVIYESIEKNFYENIDEQVLIEGACKGMVDALGDPYSAYLTKEEFSDWKSNVTGEYSGIGITFTQDNDGNYVVVAVTEDSPAEKAGLKAGDFILEADGKSYDTMTLMSAAIRGEEGTAVEVKYSRNGKEQTVSIIRKKIVQHSVDYEMIDEDTGYIKIDSFIENTDEDFTEALNDIEKQGAENLILDLRNNGGGLVDSCLNIADEFLDEDIIMYAEAKDGSRKDYYAEDGSTDLETVVLVNENSASASEILAAALKDNGFVIIGRNTFGKGIIQSTSELKDGSALELTILQYFSPKGNAIHKKGVKPDYEVKNDENSATDNQLEKAKELL